MDRRRMRSTIKLDSTGNNSSRPKKRATPRIKRGSKLRDTASSKMEKYADTNVSKKRGVTSSKKEKYADTPVSSKRVVASSKKEKYPNTSVSKKQEKASSLKPKTPDTSVSKKRAASKTPASEKAVKTVKTKGGDYKVYKKDSASAKSFRQAFNDARKAGEKVFTWNGKKYSTAVK